MTDITIHLGHICNDCAINAGHQPKRPADSGRKSWLCKCCGHYNIGSTMEYTIGDWLIVKPLRYREATGTRNLRSNAWGWGDALGYARGSERRAASV